MDPYVHTTMLQKLFMCDKLASKSSQPTTGSHGTAHWCNYMIALVKYSFYKCEVAIGLKVGPNACLSCISNLDISQLISGFDFPHLTHSNVGYLSTLLIQALCGPTSG